MAGLNKEIWTGEVIRQFTHTGEFLDGIPDMSQYVDNDVIHLTEIGVKPDVLINNTTYPIPVQDTDDADVTISLDKFQTKSTNITDDEIEYIAYNKVQEYTKSHAESLEESTMDKAAHALAPAANTADTPIVLSSGAANAAGHKALKPGDIANLKKKFDDLKIPKKGRRLVLCSQHVNDLLLTDEAFERQYKDNREGAVLRLYGFDIYEYSNCPQYYLQSTAWKKRAFGSEQAADREASFAFYAPRVFKARGAVKFFYKDASTDPDTQSTRFNYKLRFIAMPKTNVAIAALVSPDA